MSGGDGNGSGGGDPLKTATAIVGLLTGVVAVVYILGGTVIALRLLFDHYSLDSVRLALGQLPRELVITTAMLTVVGPAVLIGLFSALVHGARADRPGPGARRATSWTKRLAFLRLRRHHRPPLRPARRLAGGRQRWLLGRCCWCRCSSSPSVMA